MLPAKFNFCSLRRSQPLRSYSYLKRFYCENSTSRQDEFQEGNEKETLPKSTLNTKEKKQVLFALNKFSKEGFLHLNKLKSKESLVTEIMEFRSQNGGIYDVNEVLKAGILNDQLLQSICADITALKMKLHKYSYCSPALTESRLKKIQSIVAIDMDNLMWVNWIKVNRQLEIEEWSYTKLHSNTEDAKRFDHVLFHNVAEAAVKKIPKACIYLFRDTGMPRVDKFQTSRDVLNFRMLRSMFLTMLKLGVHSGERSDIFFVNVQSLPDLYGQKVPGYSKELRARGSYRTLCELLQDDQNQLFNLKMSPLLRRVFFSKSALPFDILDHYASTALLANSFYKLVAFNVW